MREKTPKYVLVIICTLFIALLGYFTLSYYGVQSAKEPDKERERVMTYCVQCYATEGVYPPDLDYLVENYGFKLKDRYYDYFYDVFAPNVRPDIIITPKVDTSSADKMTEALYGE